jgi:hypothetical protein
MGHLCSFLIFPIMYIIRLCFTDLATVAGWSVITLHFWIISYSQNIWWHFEKLYIYVRQLFCQAKKIKMIELQQHHRENYFNKTRNKAHNKLFISRSYSSQRVQIWQLEVKSAVTSLHLLISWSVIIKCYTQRQQDLCSWYKGCGKVSDIHWGLLLWWKVNLFIKIKYWLQKCHYHIYIIQHTLVISNPDQTGKNFKENLPYL